MYGLPPHGVIPTIPPNPPTHHTTPSQRHTPFVLSYLFPPPNTNPAARSASSTPATRATPTSPAPAPAAAAAAARAPRARAAAPPRAAAPGRGVRCVIRRCDCDSVYGVMYPHAQSHPYNTTRHHTCGPNHPTTPNEQARTAAGPPRGAAAPPRVRWTRATATPAATTAAASARPPAATRPRRRRPGAGRRRVGRRATRLGWRRSDPGGRGSGGRKVTCRGRTGVCLFSIFLSLCLRVYDGDGNGDGRGGVCVLCV